MVAANKWDLVSDTEIARKEFRDEVYYQAPFLEFAAVRFMSAKTGSGVEKLLSEARAIRGRHRKIFDQKELNDTFKRIHASHAPRGKMAIRLRLQKITQDIENPRVFFIWCSDPRMVTPAFERSWARELTRCLRLEGVPVTAVFRRKVPSASSRRRARR